MLHAALGNAANWLYVVENVAEQLKPPGVPRRKPTVWTPAQLRTFLTFVRLDRFYPLYLLAATTGLRRAELCGCAAQRSTWMPRRCPSSRIPESS